MAYYNNYLYKEITRKDSRGNEHLVRLEIKIKSDVPVLRDPKEIGKCLAGLDIELGGNDSVIAPIVKSSCNITLVDRTDYVDDSDTMSKGWEIFYTSDATKFKVLIYQDGQLRWSGFITPDSYTEDMEYYPIVTITARDMLGALSDYECKPVGNDANMISVYDFINQALATSNILMVRTQDDLPLFGRTEDGEEVGLDSAMLNVELFDGDNWYDALEKVLASFGLVCRWIDDNKIMIAALADLPTFTLGNMVVQKEATFINSTGSRTLDPAYKQIVEKTDWDTNSAYGASDLQDEDYTDKSFTYDGQEVKGAATLKGWNFTTGMAVLNPYKSGVGLPAYNPNQQNTVYMFCFRDGFSTEAMYKQISIYTGEAFNVAFTILWETAGRPKAQIGFKYQIRMVTSAGRYIYRNTDGSYAFGEGMTTLVKRPGTTTQVKEDVSVELAPYDAVQELAMQSGETIQYIEVRLLGFYWADTSGNFDYGQYFYGIENLVVDTANEIPSGGQKVTTIYNENNNVTLERSSAVTQGGWASPKVVINSVYYNKPPYKPLVRWYLAPLSTGEALTPFQAVVHKEILAYFSKPNNILTGDFIVPDDNARANNVYIWREKKHILTGGNINLLNGRVERATLREYLNYSDLWEN